MDKIPVSGVVSPIYDTDKYPVIDPRFGIDGLRSLPTVEDMYNIPLEKRRAGMLVVIPGSQSTTNQYYTLKPEVSGVTWSVGESSNWDVLVLGGGSQSGIPVKYLIENETITIPPNYEYLIWGNMQVGSSGSFVNSGKAYVINGTISLGGSPQGSTSGPGEYYYLTVPTKYIQTFTCTPFGVTITHNLGTEDITYSIRENNNFVTVNVEVIDLNSILVTSYATFSNAKITVLG